MKKRFPLSGLILVLITFLLSQSTGDSQAQDLVNQFYFPIVGKQILPRWIGPAGGSAIALAVDAKNANIAYVGTTCGVYKSTNGGEKWASTGPGLCYMIDSLAVDPTNSEIIYAGSHGGGVYKSTNGGADWSPVNNGIHANAVVYTVTVNPGNTNLVFAGTRGAPHSGGPPWGGVLYKSINGGASWSAILTNIGGSSQQDWIYSIRANPNQPNYMIAASHEHGPFVSSDYGNAGTWSSQDTSVDGSGRAIGFDPRSWLQTAFYATWHRTGIYRSSNNGSSWSLSNTGLGEAKIYPNGIAFDLSGPNVIYLASFADALHGVMKSTDSGYSWNRAGMSDYYIYSVASPGFGNNTVLAGTYGNGVFKSTNGGGSWYRSSTGITNINITGIATTSLSTYLVSVPGSGVYRSNDSGANWFSFNTGLSDVYINGLVSHPDNPNLVFALTSKAGVQKIDLSSGGGWTAAEFNATILPGSLSLVPASDLPVPIEPMVELLGHVPGQEKAPVNSEPEESVATITAPVLSMIFAPSNSNIAYLGTNGAGLYTTTNSGVSWEQSGLTSGMIRAIAVHPTNSSLLYASTSTAGQVKVSSNGAINWADLPLITGSPVVHSLMVSPVQPDLLYAGTSNGIWRYNGSAWSLIGLAGYPVNVIRSNPQNPEMYYAGTPYGAYSSDDHTNWTEIPMTVLVPVQMIQFSFIDGLSCVYLETTNHGVLQMYVNK